MGFPPASVTPPTFTQYPAVAIGDLVLGVAPFFLRGDPGQGLQGLIDMPTVRTGDPDAPRAHGAYIGLDLLGERTPTITLDVGPPFGAYLDLPGAMAALRSTLTPTGTTEIPLWFQLDAGSPMFVSMVRPRKRTTNVDIPYALGSLAQGVAMQFAATDPVLYAAGTQQQTVVVPDPLGGFSFNLSFNLDFGGGAEYGAITATNYGDMPCYPVIVFTGPCESPMLTNASIVGNPFVQFAMTLFSGDTLTVNTDPKYRSAQYVTAGTSQGQSRLYTLAPGSQWWSLPPDSSCDLEFTTADVSPSDGTCAVQWTSAYSAGN